MLCVGIILLSVYEIKYINNDFLVSYNKCLWVFELLKSKYYIIKKIFLKMNYLSI